MLTRVAAKMRKGPFVRLEKLRHPLIGTGIIESAATEAQREHEDVHDRRNPARKGTVAWPQSI